MNLLESLSQAVVSLRREEVVRLAEQAVAEGIPAEQAITEGLAGGMRIVGQKFTAKEFFVPEVLAAGRALYAGMDVLAPHVERVDGERGTAVVGVVAGDYHDIGKNIVKLMLSAAGVRVVDLGKNVSVDRLLKAVEEEKADVVGLSTLMTTTLDTMADQVDQLKQNCAAGVLVGGAPVSESFARDIGADGTANDAGGAVELFLRTVERVRA
jgi:5-methyltetrahydrofolate--homocysteine methyltransferase